MPRRHGSWNGPDEWSYEGDWPRPGTEAWQGFGRRMLLRAIMFFALMLVLVIGVVVFVVSVVTEVGGLSAALIILATPLPSWWSVGSSDARSSARGGRCGS